MKIQYALCHPLPPTTLVKGAIKRRPWQLKQRQAGETMTPVTAYAHLFHAVIVLL